MATIDQQFIEFIVKTLVNNPDEVKVDRTIDERGVLLTLSVDPEDVGRVIGRRGATAQSIRTLLRVLGTKNDARYNLKIVNTDNYDPEAQGHDAPATETAEASTDTDADEAPAATETSTDTDTDTDTDDTSALAEKTRAELADLDDLDI